MAIYIRFENEKQVETTILENKPEGEGWYKAPEDFDWQKSYRLTEGDKIVERSKEDIQRELLDHAKLCALNCLNMYFNRYANRYTGYSHAKAKSYEMQAKAAENILKSEEGKKPLNNKDVEIIEPLAKVRGISVTEMAESIQEKAEKAVKAIAKCEELEDIAKERIKKAKDEAELQDILEHCKCEMQKVIVN